MNYGFMANITLMTYCKSSIRSRPCIILDPKFHRLVLEVIKSFIDREKKSEVKEGPLRTPKMPKRI